MGRRFAWMMFGNLAVTGFAHAQANLSSLTFCEASILTREAEQAKSNLPDGSRLHEMERNFNEIVLLRREATTNKQVPYGFLKNCLEKKQEVFRTHVVTAGGNVKGKAAYSMLMGRYYEAFNQTKDAFDRYVDAMQRDVSDYVAPYNAYRMWIQMQTYRFAMIRQASGTAPQKEIDSILTETNRFLVPVINNPRAPVAMKIEAFEVRARILDELNRTAEATSDWRQILTLDPKNVAVLKKLADFEFQRGRSGEAAKLLERLVALEPKNLTAQRDLATLQLEADDPTAAEKTAEAALKAFPGDVELTALRAQALAEMGELKAGQALIEQAYGKSPKNRVVLKAKAFIHIAVGDSFVEQKLPGNALVEYKKGLELESKSPKIRTKMGILLHSYRAGLNFKPDEASRLDMNQAAEFLEPLMSNDYVDQKAVEALIGAAAHSAKPARGRKGCERYKDEFGSFSALSLVLDCATIYKSAGLSEKARKTLEDALADTRFRGNTSKITGALTNLN